MALFPQFAFASSVSPLLELTFNENTRIYGLTAQDTLGKSTGTLEEFAAAMANENIESYAIFPGNYFNAYESSREVFGGIYSQGKIIHDDFMDWGCGFDSSNKFHMFSLISIISNENDSKITVFEEGREIEIVTAFNCYPWLIKDGERYPFSPRPGMSEDFLNARAQRAFMGQKSDGTFIYGMLGNATIKQLQDIAVELGLVNAVNTDGGASAGLYRDGRYLARPGRELASVVFIAEESAAAPPETAPDQPAPLDVNPTASTVYLNGEAKAFEAYLIDGNNYFKLRDLAYVLNDTPKRFEVAFNSETMAITLTSGQPYTTVGGEMAQGDGVPKEAIPTPSTIYLDGNVLNLVAYNIGGNNFFRLRDLMEAMDVYVGYDNNTRAITLDTSEGYVAQ